MWKRREKILHRTCALIALLAALAGAPTRAAEIEPWASRDLTVLEGLVAWYDAAAQTPALQAVGGAPLISGDSLPQWLDSSGNERHLRQPDAASQPTFYLKETLAAIRFSGRGSHQLLPDQTETFENLTIFLVAAPHHNEGNFRGLLSMHAKGQFDYLSGMTVDLGPVATPDFSFLNVEGAGFVGAQNLRTRTSPPLELRRLCITSAVEPQGVALYVDGMAEGRRDRAASTARMDRLIVGGRYYGGDEAIRGFFAGDIAEAIIYDRVLSDQERDAVDRYLAAKYHDAGPIEPPPELSGGQAVKRVVPPPAVQVHVPGFVARELPVTLPNVNNVLYREDGALVALGYDGNVHLLTDSDGDGLEDRVELFWKNKGDLRAPIGMALTPPGYNLGRGVFVAAKSKCVLLLDADGDDRAEQEIVVAQGWTELPHGVDALGVAVDPRDHSVLLGLGVQNFANPFLVEPDGTSKFRLDGERGTILRIAPDFKSREVVATGIRFPVAIRFNADGELFCTDQEGATWLPNGNPFDELLHVQPGRHYGFPPRHPRFLPDVIDEPSVFDYRPQHQSTCGLAFNEPSHDGAVFGPDWWRSDALVAGYSRGKLYRTKLVQSPHGYVAQNQLAATLSMMPADVCVAPNHSVVIAAHSGGPDWGSGPSGMGKLYKITHADRKAPIPSLVWAESPREVRIAFDRPVDPAMLKDLAARASIDGGEFVAAADRFESIRPGYATVERQLRAARFGVEVLGVQLTADRRTLILTTSPHSAAVGYSITLPGIAPAPAGESGNAAIPQLPDVDLAYDLCGVEATWQPDQGEPRTVWLPHLETTISAKLTQESAEHRDLWNQLKSRPGKLTLRTVLNLHNMLRPAIQPGSVLDHTFPTEKVSIGINSNGPADVIVAGKSVAGMINSGYGDSFTVVPEGDAATLEITLRIAANELPDLRATYSTNEDPRPRDLPLNRMLLPWAQQSGQTTEVVDNSDLPELQGGNWLRGQREFFGDQAACSKCHAMRGAGGTIGPDLSNLPQRDYASVLRDVTLPSYAINPDYVTQNVLLLEGRVVAGTVRTEGDRLVISQQDAKQVIVARDEVDVIEHSPLSIMPEGIPKTLGPERLRDLLTFLLVEAPHMPVYGDAPPPPPRSMAEVDAVLASGDPLQRSPRKLDIVLVSGAKDHGPGEHDYPAWQKAWKSLLGMSDGVNVTVANDWPREADFKSADVLVFYQQGRWTADRARDADAFLRRGGGLVYIHYAVDGGADPTGFAERIGLAWQGGRSKFRHGPLDVQFAAGISHPIARNFDRVHFHDESYWNLVGDAKGVQLLATGLEENNPQPLFWTTEPLGGRVFVSIPGHFAWTFDDPLFRLLLLRGIAWTAKEPVDRFNELVLPGARVRPLETAKSLK